MRRFLLSVPIVIVAVVGCSAGNVDDLGLGGSGGGSSFSNGTQSGGTQSTGAFGTGASTGTGGDDGCSAESQLVYVFTSSNQIYSFDPPTKQFTFVATPDCVAGGSANSMAIDRNLVAWINYIGGIYTFDLKTKTGCQLATNLQPPYQQIGMGFSTDMEGGKTETLYIDGIGGGGLAKVDTSTKTVTPIGGFGNDPNLQSQSAELTGTGSARLFGYFTTFPYVRVAEIDKSNANIISDFELSGVSPPSSWAWSFWGGDFYLYAADIGNSRVIKYSPATNAVDQNYVSDTGFTIVGAGVSTCAPIVPPS
jgi:hypothetical protein